MMAALNMLVGIFDRKTTLKIKIGCGAVIGQVKLVAGIIVAGVEVVPGTTLALPLWLAYQFPGR